MAVEDINKRVRAMSEKNIEKGQEMEEVQKSQSELLNINNERRNNLNTARVESAMEAENNQNLAQAATLMAAGVGGGMAVSQQVQGFNPQTQALLSKYGVGKPKQNTITSKNSQVTPQKVTINNTTTTNTTNNVQVSQPNIPISQPQIAIKQQANQGEGKIKAWLSGVFARQNERAALREKEYQKRESTLTRSANKMMRRMEEVGKTFAERLDPRRIGNVFGDQIKTLMFLFGFGMLSKNWDKVLGFVSKAEEFYNWVKGDKDGFLDGLGARLTKFIGGKDGETLSQAFTNLFSDLKSMVTDAFKNFGADITDKFKMFMETRAEAIKAIEFPDIDVTNLGGSIKALGQYLGDVLSALVGGTEGVKKSIGHKIDNIGLIGSLQERKGGESITKEYSGGKYDEVDDTSYGDAVLVKGDKNGKTYQGLLSTAITSEGELKNTASATISQARAIDSTFADSKDGIINTAQAASGLSRLSKVAQENGSVIVDPSFITTKLSKKQVNDLIASKDIRPVKYKLIRTEKTEEDLPANFKQKVLEEGMKTMAANKAGDSVGGVAGYGVRAGIGLKRVADGDDVLGGLVSMVPGVGDNLAYIDDILDGISSQVARWAADKYKLELVPLEDPRRAAVRLGENTPEAFNFYEITPKALKEVGKAITGDENVVIDTGDQSFVQAIQSKLEENAKKYDGKRNNPNLPANYRAYDINVDSEFKELSDLEKRQKAIETKYNQLKEERWDEWRAEHGNNRVNQTVNNTVELAKKGIKAGKNLLNSAYDYFTGTYKPKYVPISDSETKYRMITAVERLVDKLGITPEQASGIVGNWMQESSLNTTAFNGAGGGEGAIGLAQWRGARIRKFEGRAKEGEGENYTGPGAGTKLGDATFDQQLDYAIWELQGSHKNAIDQLKAKATDPTSAADIGLGYYEFSAGIDKALEQLGDHAMLDKRRDYAWTAYQLYNESSGKDILPDETGTNEPEVLLADTKSFIPESTPETLPNAPWAPEVLDNYSNPEQSNLAFNTIPSVWTPKISTEIPISSATPVEGTNFAYSSKKSTSVGPLNKPDENLPGKLDTIVDMLEAQAMATQNLALGVTALGGAVAQNTGGTTINYGGGNISRDPSYINIPQNIGG